MVIVDIELLQVCSILMRRDGLKSDGTCLENWIVIPIYMKVYMKVVSAWSRLDILWVTLTVLHHMTSGWLCLRWNFSYPLIIMWYYFFVHNFRVWLSCHLELHQSLLLHADPFHLILSIIIISLSYIYRMDIQYPQWHISATSINYRMLKVGTVRTRVDCKCIMNCSVVLLILDVQSILIEHRLLLLNIYEFLKHNYSTEL